VQKAPVLAQDGRSPTAPVVLDQAHEIAAAPLDQPEPLVDPALGYLLGEVRP
jgi:hypothetical protein